VVDLQGRVLRRLTSPALGSSSTLLAKVGWDGRDEDGRQLMPGRYWVRAAQRGGFSARGGFILLR